MLLVRLKTEVRLEPFAEPADNAQVAGDTQQTAMAQTAADCGLECRTEESLSDFSAGLLCPDYFFGTRAILKRFLSLAGQGVGLWRLWLRKGPLTDYLAPLAGLEEKEGALAYDLFFLRGQRAPAVGWTELRSWLVQRAQPLVIDSGGWVEEITLSRPGPPRMKLGLPRTDLLAAHLVHWVHILWLNHLLCRVRLQECWEERGRRLPFWHGPLSWRRLAKLNIVGPGCDIHPTAYVEGSVLGRGVRLGPKVFVRESILGDGVEVSDFSRFYRCVVGKGCHTLNDSHFSCSTFYPDSTLASFSLRNSVIGRRVFLTSGVMFWDEPMTGTVSVRQRGREVDTGRHLLGGCAGHGCLLGTRAIFLPGRAVPNDTIIVMRPEEGVVKLPQQVEPGRPFVYQDGGIRPLEESLPGYRPAELE